jgi:hypothetical protein
MSDLRGTSAPGKVNFGAQSKVFAAIGVAVGICALAAYGYKTGQFHVNPKPAVTNGQLPTDSGSSGQ